MKKRMLSLLLASLMVLTSVPLGMVLSPMTTEAKMVEDSAEVAENAADEGMVLLENKPVGEGKALPLAKGETVALFGVGQIVNPEWAYGFKGATKPGYIPGGGGSAFVDSGYVVSPLDAFKEASERGDISLNATVAAIYKTAAAGETLSADPITTANIKTAATMSDTAVVIFSRFSSEGSDRTVSGDYTSYYLLESELKLLADIKNAGFKKTVVVLNIPGATDTTWAKNDTNDTYGVDALLVAWLPGSDGARSITNILTGAVNPSGKLTDTFASSLNAYPTSANFFSNYLAANNVAGVTAAGQVFGTQTTYYRENIYVGYRYFETFDPTYSTVNYEFGFGLSYTDFEMSNATAKVEGDTVTVSVTVKNTGDVAGKEVAQVYFGAPQKGTNGAKLTKAAKELAAFAKTELLNPGESQTLTMTFDVKDMASYDDLGVTGIKSAYVLEAGTYTFYVGNSVRDAGTRVAGTYEVTSLTVTEQLSQVLTPAKTIHQSFTYDASAANNFSWESITGDSTAHSTLMEQQNDPEELKAPEGVSKITFKDVYSGKYTVEQWAGLLSNEELVKVLKQSGAVTVLGMPTVRYTDGPAGLRFYTPATLTPSATLLGCSWNMELIEEMGDLLGREMKLNGIHGMWGPSANIHRNPLCGRNFEYISEDPLLSGKYAAAMVRGIQKQGCAVTLKHFFANNQEYSRSGNDVYATERTLREIYLRPFEIAIRDLNQEGEIPLTGIMTSYNNVNGKHTSFRYDLLETVTRREWGFKGFFLSDWGSLTKDNFPLMVQVGHDCYLGSEDPSADLLAAVEAGTVTRAQLQYCAVNVIKQYVRLLNGAFAVTKVSGNSQTTVKMINAAYEMLNCGSENSSDYDGGKHISHILSAYEGVEIPEGTYAQISIDLDVEQAGSYDISFRYGAPMKAMPATLHLDGSETALASFTFAKNGGWQSFNRFDACTVTLPEGRHSLSLRIYSNGGNIGNMYIAPTGLNAVTDVNKNSNLYIEAESYTRVLGGGSVLENGSASGGKVVNGLQQTAEVEYLLNATENVQLFLSAIITGDDVAHLEENEGAFNVYVDNVLMGSVVNKVKLGSSFAETDQISFSMPTGKHTLRLVFTNGGLALDRLRLVRDLSEKAHSISAADGVTNLIYAGADSVMDKSSGIGHEPSYTTSSVTWKLDGVSITDTNANNAFHMQNGRFLTYAVKIDQPGYYSIRPMAGCQNTTGEIDLTVDSDSENVMKTWSLTSDFAGTSWRSYKTASAATVYLGAGYHTLTFTIRSETTGDLCNFLGMTVEKYGKTLAPNSLLVLRAAKGTLEGFGDSKLENTSDVGGGQHVGWFYGGCTISFPVDVQESGSYLFDLRSMSYGSSHYTVLVDGEVAADNIAFVSNKQFHYLKDGPVALELTAGLHTVTLRANNPEGSTTGGESNVNYLLLYKNDLDFVSTDLFTTPVTWQAEDGRISGGTLITDESAVGGQAVALGKHDFLEFSMNVKENMNAIITPILKYADASATTGTYEIYFDDILYATVDASALAVYDGRNTSALTMAAGKHTVRIAVTEGEFILDGVTMARDFANNCAVTVLPFGDTYYAYGGQYYTKHTGIGQQTQTGRKIDEVSIPDNEHENLYRIRHGRDFSFIIYVAEDGEYELSPLVAGNGSTTYRLDLTLDGGTEVVTSWAATTDFRTINWSSYITAKAKTVTLTQGYHELKLTAVDEAKPDTNLCNFLRLNITKKDADNFVSFKGYQARLTGYYSLRSLYTVDPAKIAAENSDGDGVVIKEIGVLAAIANGKSVTDLTVALTDGVYAAVDTASEKIVAYNGSNWGEADKHLFVSSEGASFAVTVTFKNEADQTKEKFNTDLLYRGYFVYTVNGIDYIRYMDMGDTYTAGISLYELSKALQTEHAGNTYIEGAIAIGEAE